MKAGSAQGGHGLKEGLSEGVRSWVNPFSGPKGHIELAQAARDPYILWSIFNRNIKNKSSSGVWTLCEPPEFNIPVMLQTVQPLHELNQFECKKAGAFIKQDYFKPLEPSLQCVHYCSAMVTAQFIQAPPDWVVRLELCLPHSTEAFVVPKAVNSSSTSSINKQEPRSAPNLQVKLPPIIGIIDDQFDFLNSYYAKDAGSISTRFLAVWDQTDHTVAQSGRVWLASQIDQQIKTHGRAFAAYSALKYPIRLRSHGVSVSSIAIKNVADEAINTPAKVENAIESVPNIVAVQLPASTVVDTSGASLGAHALDAMHYVFNTAALHTPVASDYKCPVVINLSYGAIAGAHDGTSILEAAMDELLTLRSTNTAIVLPAGNARQTQTHVSGDIKPGEVFAFNWTMPPSDATDNFLEIWVEDNASIEVQVTPPYGEAASGWVGNNKMKLWQAGQAGQGELAETVGALINIGQSTNSNAHWQTLIALAPTQYSRTTPRALVAAGVFKIEVKNASAAKINMQAWVERDDAVLGFDGGGQQSTLSYIGTDWQAAAALQELGTLNSIANGEHTISVGAYTQQGGKPSDYSGECLIDKHRTNPLTVAAPGDEGEGPWRGVEVREALGTDTFRVGGTSLAAPAVTRWLADYMYQHITLQQPLANIQIKQALEAQAAADEKKQPIKASSLRVGSGRLAV